VTERKIPPNRCAVPCTRDISFSGEITRTNFPAPLSRSAILRVQHAPIILRGRVRLFIRERCDTVCTSLCPASERTFSILRPCPCRTSNVFYARCPCAFPHTVEHNGPSAPHEHRVPIVTYPPAMRVTHTTVVRPFTSLTYLPAIEVERVRANRFPKKMYPLRSVVLGKNARAIIDRT